MPRGCPGKASRSARSQETSSFAPPISSLVGGMVLRRLLLAVLLVGGCKPSDRQTVRPSERIVSLLPSFTEILFDIGAGDRVVGRTQWCDYPPAALAVPSVGDGMPPNIEAVLARRPDLVVLYNSGPNVAAAKQFERIGIKTALIDLNRLQDLGAATRELGRLTGQFDQADSLANILDSIAGQAMPPPTTSAAQQCERIGLKSAPIDLNRLQDLGAATRELGRLTGQFDQADSLANILDSIAGQAMPPPTTSVAFVVWDNPPIVIGRGSYLDQIAAAAGARHVFTDIAAPSAQVSLATIVDRNPEWIAVLSDSGAMPSFARRPEWRAIRAVRERHFLLLKGSLFGRPGPRSGQAIAELKRMLAK